MEHGPFSSHPHQWRGMKAQIIPVSLGAGFRRPSELLSHSLSHSHTHTHVHKSISPSKASPHVSTSGHKPRCWMSRDRERQSLLLFLTDQVSRPVRSRSLGCSHGERAPPAPTLYFPANRSSSFRSQLKGHFQVFFPQPSLSQTPSSYPAFLMLSPTAACS